MRVEHSVLTRKRSVFIVDDHPIVRAGLAELIDREPDLAVCGGAGEMHGALCNINSIKPDVLIVDISLNGPDGLDLLKSIRAKTPSLPVLIMSMHAEETYAERCLRAGANGYIMKHEATERVLTALRRVLNREIYLSERMASQILRHVVTRLPALREEPRSMLDGLSDRELEVLRLIGDGHTTREIAHELHLSIKTVETHLGHVRDKLHLKNGREVMQYAMQWAIPRLRNTRAAVVSGIPRA